VPLPNSDNSGEPSPGSPGGNVINGEDTTVDGIIGEPVPDKVYDEYGNEIDPITGEIITPAPKPPVTGNDKPSEQSPHTGVASGTAFVVIPALLSATAVLICVAKKRK
jgi:hypothetical protein